jgi:DNA-binding CsgD family transcriptional regulator/tetratricopeptide (TPR) repeat protein
VNRTWPLVGRREELARITNAWRTGGGGVVLVGQTGVGKTRLAIEALTAAEAAGAVTARVAATAAAAAIPLGALAPLVPELGAGMNPLIAGRQALQNLAGDRRLVLLGDDAHLFDEVSATLIFQVAAHREVFVVVTARSGERLPEPITGLWKDGHAERIDVGVLPDREVDELTTALLGGQVDAAAARGVRNAAHGNPLAVRELVLAGCETGALQHHQGRWVLTSSLSISARLGELVDQRMGALADDETGALELLAMGEPIGVALLDRLSSPAVVGSLERKGLLEARADGRRFEAWLAHPFHGEVLRARITPFRRRRILGTLAAAIEECGARRRGDQLRIATWRVDARIPTDPALLLDAARQSLRAFDFNAAARLGRAAWEVRRSWEVGATYGVALALLSENDEADSVLAATEALTTTDDERAAIAVARAEGLFFSLEREADARAVLKSALAAVNDDDAAAELVAYQATIDLLVGRFRDAMKAVEPLVAGQRQRPFVAGSNVAVPALYSDGRPEAARELAERARQVHAAIWQNELSYQPPDIPLGPRRGGHAYNMAMTLIEEGRLDEAHELASERFRRCDETGRWRAAAWYQAALSRVTLLQGRVATTARHAAAADELMNALGYRDHRRMALGHLVAARALAGDLSGARAAQAAVDDLSGRLRIYEPFVVEGRAWLAAAEGQLPEARSILDPGADEAIAIGQVGLATHLLHALARVGGAEAAVERLSRLAAARDTPFIATRAAHVRALIEGDAAGLEAAAEAFEKFGAMLQAAEGFAAASRTWRRDGDGRRATAASNCARALAARCEGAHTPGLAELAAATPLTDREVDVAMLAAQGHTTREVAERLYLSARTVDNHLQRIYTKLGVRGRRELAAALGVDRRHSR